MVSEDAVSPEREVKLHFNFGTFEGFNFKSQSAIERLLTAEEIINWDHDNDGESEFWPSGDHHEVTLIFREQNSVTYSELVALDALLEQLGGDETQNFLRIYHALSNGGGDLSSITVNEVEDSPVNLFIGDCFVDLRKDAAYELFETYWPEEYKIWESSHCDGLIFDVDQFLNSAAWSVEEVMLGDRKVLLICPH